MTDHPIDQLRAELRATESWRTGMKVDLDDLVAELTRYRAVVEAAKKVPGVVVDPAEDECTISGCVICNLRAALAATEEEK